MPVTKTINFLPTVFRSDYNQKFLNATLDQLVTEPNLQPINGYVGRKLAPGYTGIGTYITEPSALRADYQLEPGMVVRDSDTDEVNFLTTYPEILQKIQYYGGITTDQDKLWASEYYTYNPRINEDAFINFGQYYWIPNGPDPVPVFAGATQYERTFYVSPDNNLDVYYFSGYGKTPNPDLVLARGGNYTFQINQTGKRFWIQTDPGLSGLSPTTNRSSRQILGVTNNGTDKGTIKFNVPTATAQDFFISMPTVQNVDLVSNISYANLQGILLSNLRSNYNGIDGQSAGLNGRFVIFGNYSADPADWTSPSGLVPTSQRYGIWQISLVPSGLDFVIELVYQRSIPVNQKVYILSGLEYGNSEWYTTSENILSQIAIITAPLSTLYYQDSEDPSQYGIIRIIESNSNYIDVDSEIIGKTNYVSPNGVTFTNGLKIIFDSSALQEQYKNKQFYIEGVGTSIELVEVSDLIITTTTQKNSYRPQNNFTLYANASLNLSQDELTIITTDFPDGVNLAIGNFPNSINNNYLVEQDLTFRFPYRVGQNIPGNNENIDLSAGTIGVTLPGVTISSFSNGASVPGVNNTTWRYDTNQVLINGQDQYGGIILEDGRYTYNNGNFISANAWGNVTGFTSGYLNTDGHSKLIGFAADGYPIYGPFGYANPTNASSGILRMASSYVANADKPYRPAPRTVLSTANIVSSSLITVSTTNGLNPGMRLTQINAGTVSNVYIINNALKTAQGLPTFPGDFTVQLNTNVNLSVGDTLNFEFLPGAFIEDYDYQPGTGTLDQYNGRFCVTPEFPEGTYAYFVTTDTSNRPAFPYIIGPNFYGSLSVDTNQSLATPDYIMISRASRDLNPWSRRNRWFHKSVLDVTTQYTGLEQSYNESLRAKRPIIEFDPNIQLINFGRTSKKPVDIFDTQFTNPFLTVQGSPGIYVDGINLVDNMRIAFGADLDPTTRGKIYVVQFVSVVGSSPSDPKIIDLVLADDGEVSEYDTVSVLNGVNNIGKSFWYNGTAWVEGQQKTSLNQAPLFDVFDTTGISFNDIETYPAINLETAFNGTKIFSYKEGTGTSDPILGFPLKYKNFNNVGDILFNNDFDTQTFSYGPNGDVITKKVNSGFLRINKLDGTYTSINVWSTVDSATRQMQNLSFIYNGIDNQFNLDIQPALAKTQPNLIVYVDAKKISEIDYQIFPLSNNGLLLAVDQSILNVDSRIDVLVYSASTSQLGFYQVPDNLNYNAQNQILENSTLGEIRNHFGQLSQNSLQFLGNFPGVSNLRDINVSNKAGTMLQQSAPVIYSGLFLTNEQFSFVDSLLYVQQEYSKFKNKFLTLASTDGTLDTTDYIGSIDKILTKINQVKDKTFPWYYSGMVPYGSNKNTIVYTIFNPLQRVYELTETFSNDVVTNKAVLVYLNDAQLIYQSDYTFLSSGPGLSINSSVNLQVDDTLTIVEYLNTDGNWIPETPSKLGLYPKFIPVIYTDRTYETPTQMLRGHDGSLTPCFGDFRDQLLLELEKRIYNNIKVSYDDKLVNIYDSKPGKFRNVGYTLAQYNNLLAKMYLRWAGINGLDYVENTSYQNDAPFSYNYYASLDVIDNETLPGSWRACYDYFYDCQTPQLSPWQMLGFSEKPDWWEDQYGPAPYTSGNRILWEDLEEGYIAQGSRQGYDTRFARPGLSNIIPVNENGVLLPPIGILTNKFDANTFNDNWLVGQMGPVETAWRNSSDYAFAVQYFMALINPGKYFSFGVNTNRYRFNTESEQYAIVDTNNRIKQTDILVNGYTQPDGTVQRATGYLNWVIDYRISKGVTDNSEVRKYLDDLEVNLIYRMAGFSGKQYLKVLAEQNSPNSTNDSIIIPDANFELILSKTIPTVNPRYSSLIIEKVSNGFKVGGYDLDQPYFTIVPPSTSGKYLTLDVLGAKSKYYTDFLRFKTNVPYGTVLQTEQQVVSLISGYERYLNILGFRFDEYDEQLGQIKNWQLSAKEFLFWGKQGWSQNSVIVLGPASGSIKYFKNNSVVDSVSDHFFGSKIINQNNQVLTTNDYTVLRDGNLFQLKLQSSVDLIGFIGMNVVQYEHTLVFDNRTQFNDIIYDPILGQRQYRLKLIGSRTGEWNGTLSAPGFIYNSAEVRQWRPNVDYLKGDLIEYKSFYYAASKDLPGTTEFKFSDWLPVNKTQIKTGLLQNFARNAQIGETYYDIDRVNLESEFDQYALSLIGYKNRSYLNEIGLNDVSQVKLYQGFIREKGTIKSINALADVTLTSDNTSRVSISEDWALRVGTYGSTDTNRYLELVLDESYTLSNPTSLEILPNNSVQFSSLYLDKDGIYKTSVVPWNPPFLLNRTADSDYSNDIKTAGFVNIEDINYTIYNLNDISTLDVDISKLGSGVTIWTANDYTNNWNVFRLVDTETTIIVITNALDQKIKIQTNKFHGLSVNDTVLMQNIGRFSGFYRVQTITGLNSFIVKYAGSLQGFSNETEDGTLLKMVSMKVDYTSDVDTITPPTGWAVDDKVWITNYDGDEEWAVLNKTEPWELENSLPKGSLDVNSYFGTSVKLNFNKTTAIAGLPGYNLNIGAVTNYILGYQNELIEDVTLTSQANNTIGLGFSVESGQNYVFSGAPNSNNGVGYTFVYRRGTFGSITGTQILMPNSASALNFGFSLAASQDDRWLYIGAPGGNKVYVYGLDNTIPTANDSVATDGILNSFGLDFTPVGEENVLVSIGGRVYVPYVDYSLSGNIITFNETPSVGTMTVIQSPGYRFIRELTGNSGGNFGYSLATTVDGAQLAVGSPTANVVANSVTYTSSGIVTIYDRTVNSYVATAEQIYFGGVSTINQYSYVTVNGVLQTLNTDYTVFGGIYIKFNTPPGAGKIVTIDTNIFNLVDQIRPSAPNQEEQFGYSVDFCETSCRLFVGAPYQSTLNTYNGAVYRFDNQSKLYGTITGTVQNPSVTPGSSIRLNNYQVSLLNSDLDYVITAINQANIPGVIASKVNNSLKLESSSVIAGEKLQVLPGTTGTPLTALGLQTYVQTEIIRNTVNKSYDYFGKKVKISDNDNTLVISSDTATTIQNTTFDESSVQFTTTFDSNSVTFKDPVAESGAVWIYGYLPDSRNTIINPGKYSFIQQLTPTTTGAPLTTNDNFGSAIDVVGDQILVGAKNNASLGQGTGKVFKFVNTNNLVGWDSYRVKDQKVDINGLLKSYIYNADTQVIQKSLDFIDPAKGKILGVAEQEISFKIDYDPAVYNNASTDTVTKSNSFYWGDQQVGQVWWDLSTVRYLEYEQGTIKYRAANWGRMFPGSKIDIYEWVESNYPPSQYQANGGNGVPKYTNNEAYVTMSYIDPVSNFTTIKYYFWVKNKSTVTTNQFGRSIPTTTIASYITDPKGSGISYYAAIRDDSIAVFNLINDTNGRKSIFHLDYAALINSNIIHNEYSLISENRSKSSAIPSTIFNKMVDSVSGIDRFGNPVPDPTLPAQVRYGIDIRPRQSMVIDKNSALKSIFTYVNSVLKNIVITGLVNTDILNQGEPIPNSNTGEYDLLVENLEELSFVNITILPAGYKVLVRTDSSVQNLWTIYVKDREVSAWQPNTYYRRNTYILNNDITYVAQTDFTSGATFSATNLAIYNVDPTWNLIRVQSYNISDYWQYINWVDPTYDITELPTYTIETVAELSNLFLEAGNTVKINNNGQGKWFVIQVYPNIVKTVAIQDGAIAFKDSLYDLEKYGIGFGEDNFDVLRFDQNPGLETREILNILKNDIFVDDLDANFVQLFFNFVNFVFGEQKTVDWIFKTSFIDVLQKIQGFTQPAIYSKENQDFYRQYIEEVKPYRSTIKDYIINYNGSDNYQGYVTDFDVVPYYDTVLKLNRSPSGEFIEDQKALENPQYRDWLLNYGYTIKSIEIISGGSNYTFPPTVTITGSSLGNDAVARASITNGIVTRIDLLYSGTNYTVSPTITITGGNGQGATAKAILENKLIRNLKTTLVYDRYTYGTDVLTWQANTAYQQGAILEYSGKAYLVNTAFTSNVNFAQTYLTEYPVTNFNNANDRIKSFYQPELGSTGKDFKLLETGIDYPGVQIDGPLYQDSAGFGASNFDTGAFDPLELDDDGTYIISDSLLDTKITSEYTDTQLGIRPEDIIVDGGAYVYDRYRNWSQNTFYDRGDLISYNNRIYYTVQPFTSNSTFSAVNLTNYNIGPYASHAPEELLPGRVFDTMDMTITTLAVDPTTYSYQDWLANSGMIVDQIVISNVGLGYNPAEISVLIDGGGFSNRATATLTVNANGSATGFTVINSGLGYQTTPNVLVSGSNTTPVIAGVVMKLSNAPSSSEPYPKMIYRIFKDMNDNYTYYRLDGSAKTTIVGELTLANTTITVSDASVLIAPAPAGTQPGVIYINGERIEYYTKNDNTNVLGELRRGTRGTGAANSYPSGTGIIDSTQNQIVIKSSNRTWYAGNTATGTINVVFGSTELVGTGTVFGTELTIAGNVFAADGRFIGIVSNITSNTSANVSQPIGFSANILEFEYGANVALTTTSGNSYTFYSNTGYIRSNLWYNLGNASATNGQGLFNSNTIQVNFIKQGLNS